MKLAQALIERKNLMTRVVELQTRHNNSAVHEQGDKPEEDTSDLLDALKQAFEVSEKLTISINRTNNIVKVADRTMMEAIARRDALKWQIVQYEAMGQHIRQRNQGHMRYYRENGPKLVVAEGVASVRFTKLVDSLSQELRELDKSIQEVNWQNELVDA